MWVDRAFCQFLTSFYNISLINLHTCPIWHRIYPSFAITFSNRDFFSIFNILNMNQTASFSNNCLPFWFSGLKQFFDTRKTLCNIVPSYPTSMESTHGQLCTRFPNRLGGNNTNCLPNINMTTSSQITPITFSANTISTLTSQCTANYNLSNS